MSIPQIDTEVPYLYDKYGQEIKVGDKIYVSVKTQIIKGEIKQISKCSDYSYARYGLSIKNLDKPSQTVYHTNYSLVRCDDSIPHAPTIIKIDHD